MDGEIGVMVSTCAKKTLDHEQQRRIELKCIELEAMLEEQGMTQVEVNEKVHQLRTILTEGEIARQMSQIDDNKPTFISENFLETPTNIPENRKEAIGLVSDIVGSSNSSGKTSPICPPGIVTPEDATPSKSKKRKRKSRDSSLSSERKKKYSKKSKKKSPNGSREKSHKKTKKDKEKYMVKKSSYRKDVKQKKSSDCDRRKKKNKKRSSRKHRSSSVRDGRKYCDDERSPSSHRQDEKVNGDDRKKKRNRSKDRRRESRKRKRERNHSKEHRRSSHKKSSSSSPEVCHKELDLQPTAANKDIIIANSDATLPIALAKNDSPLEKIDALDNKIETEPDDNISPEQILEEPIEKYHTCQEDPNKEDASFEMYKAPKFDAGRRERVPEIAPFRIEPRNNLLLREKIARPFSSPFKKVEEAVKPVVFIPKDVEKETVADDSVEKLDSPKKVGSPSKVDDEKADGVWNLIGNDFTEATGTERKTGGSKGHWSSSASSSSRSSRGRSICSTCSSEESDKYAPESGRRRQYHSGSPSSRSSSSSRHSRSRSPSIPRRRGSPSFLDRRRITSARKRPIPYHRSSPMSSSSESRRYSNNGYSSSDNDDSSASSYSGRSWSRSRSRSDSREYSC